MIRVKRDRCTAAAYLSSSLGMPRARWRRYFRGRCGQEPASSVASLPRLRLCLPRRAACFAPDWPCRVSETAFEVVVSRREMDLQFGLGKFDRLNRAKMLAAFPSAEDFVVARPDGLDRPALADRALLPLGQARAQIPPFSQGLQKRPADSDPAGAHRVPLLAHRGCPAKQHSTPVRLFAPHHQYLMHRRELGRLLEHRPALSRISGN